MENIALALGSNLGDRAANLRAALVALSAVAGDIEPSPVYETAPRYVADQPAFLNMVALARTALAPFDLLDRLQAIEDALGRVRKRRYGPRLIDLDMLYYGDRVIDAERLIVPHPRLHERGFALRPLADLAPRWRDPRSGRAITQILAALDEPEADCVAVGALPARPPENWPHSG